MRGNNKNYTKALIIVHGKSEKQICDYIIQNLRLKIEIKSDKKGEKSIQINSIMNILNSTEHKNLNAFYKTYSDLNIVGKGRKREIVDFKIFIIMDLDDCIEENKRRFLDKSMFKDHWAYKYIVPIYNDKNLEEALIECGVKYKKVHPEDMKKKYIKIFPTSNRDIQNTADRIEVNDFVDMIKSSKKTNLSELIEYCINC